MVNTLVSSTVLTIAILAIAVAPVTAAPPDPAQLVRWIIAKPHPEYPIEAQARRARGSGVFKLHFKTKTGTVRRVDIVQSTGDKALDAACIKAYSKWRFKPGVLPSIKSINSQTKEPFADEDFIVKIPVTFSLAAGPQVKSGGITP